MDPRDEAAIAGVVSQLFPDAWRVAERGNRDGAKEGGAPDLSEAVQLLAAAAMFVTAAGAFVKAGRGAREVKQEVEALLPRELLERVSEEKRVEAIALLGASEQPG
jgi:hypothetical protein